MSTTLTKQIEHPAPWLLHRPGRLAAISLSFAYALVVVLFPWDAITRAGFPDFTAYVDEFSNQTVSKLELYQLSGLKEYFSFEVLWDQLVRWLTRMIGDASIALRLISFFILVVWSLFLFRRAGIGIALLFLFNPTAIDVGMSGMRNGLAWALVLVGLTARRRPVRGALFLSAVFIHSSTIVLLLLYYLTLLAARVIRGKTLAVWGVGFGVVLGLTLTVGAQLVFGELGDRRIGQGYAVGGGSLLQASLWGILLVLQCTSGRDYVRANIFIIAILAWYETMNPFIPWSYRIWGAFLPLIAVSALSLPPRKRQAFVYLYSGYLVIQFVYWTKLLNGLQSS